MHDISTDPSGRSDLDELGPDGLAVESVRFAVAGYRLQRANGLSEQGKLRTFPSVAVTEGASAFCRWTAQGFPEAPMCDAVKPP